jgi:hypothetical protein
MTRESKFDDDDDDDGDELGLFDDELVDAALEAFELRRENARDKVDFRRLVEQKLELKNLQDELGLYSISGKDSE